MKKYTKGFTLIELLVVIAIIGILSSVVLASLNTARNKGKDASAQGSLSGMRSAAEVYYSDKNQYASTTNAVTYGSIPVTSGTVSVCDSSEIVRLAVAAKAQTGKDAKCVVGQNAGSYLIESGLNGTTGYCVDSAGNAGASSTGYTTATTGDVKCKI